MSENTALASAYDADDIEELTLEVNLETENANSQINEAVTGRRGVARKYVRRVCRRNPSATPAEIIVILGKHYITAISAVGIAMAVGGVAAECGLAVIPGGGVAAAGAKVAAKKAGEKAAKVAVKTAIKTTALGAAQNGTALLPAGEERLQFEITALYVLAIADIHGMELGQEQAHALVFGLTNSQVSQQQIATMAATLLNSGVVGAEDDGQGDCKEAKDISHWANVLADSLPNETAQSLVRGVQNGALGEAQAMLSEKQQVAVNCGAGALASGINRFVFGREVVAAASMAFREAPEVLPEHLCVTEEIESPDDVSNKAFEALECAAQKVSSRTQACSKAVTRGAMTAADKVSRPFRKLDIDGDGVPDEPQALKAAKGFGGAIAGAARKAKGAATFSHKSRRDSCVDDER
jgi:hypothetical protein